MQLPKEILEQHNVFTGEQWLYIDIANCFGLDKETWIDRLLWTELHWDILEDMIPTAELPLLYKKAVHALRLSEKGFSIGHNMFLDACNSGAQIYAVLTGCKKTASNCGLILLDQRIDAYTQITTQMENILEDVLPYSRDEIKAGVMTALYNSIAEPIKLCGKDTPELAAFYAALNVELPGAMVALNAINGYWNPRSFSHTWSLPDGHVAHVPVTEVRTTRIEVDELEHTTFAYRFESNEPSLNGRSLAPNIIHSVDAYVAREMVRMANTQGFEVAHIHDSFCSHPGNMNQVVSNYRTILAKIADSDLLSDILSEIYGEPVILNKFSDNLSVDILNSKYALS